MASGNISPQPYRELAHRANDGLEVILFWQKLTDELTITVSDERSGAYFELAASPDQALDVFDHPYAHAAFRGLPYASKALHRGLKPQPERRPPTTPNSRSG